MKTTALLQRDIQDALDHEPTLAPVQISVTVSEGTVTLAGTVDNYAKKLLAERAVRQLKGVKAVVGKIEVELSASGAKKDKDLAAEIAKALRWDYSVPDAKIKVKVKDGYVTLDGSVSWDYERQAALREVAGIIGVKGIGNNLRLEPAETNSLEKNVIGEAISRHWSLSKDNICIGVKNNTVILTGTVASLYQKDEAEKIAWKTPGVQSVDNRLEVAYKLADY